MFGNKKQKNINKDAEKDINKEDEKIKAINERVEKEIDIHSMPQKFKAEKQKASQSKTVGMIIIIGGIILMVVSVIVLYYFLFISPNKQNVPVKVETPKEEKVTEDQTQPEVKEEEAVEVVEPTEEATTTIEIIAEATSTEDIVVIEEPEETNGMADTDGDGLTNKEEILFGTDINDEDTDGDGYSDLSEVLNLYDPISPGSLKENPNIEVSSANLEYEVLYPKSWTKNFFDDSLILNSSENHLIQIVVQPNTDFLSIEDWYSEFVRDANVSESQKITNNNWDGIRSEDGFEVYLTDKERKYIFVISYTPLIDEEPIYKNIHDIIIRSFIVR